MIFASRASPAGPVRPGLLSRPDRPARSDLSSANSNYVYSKEKYLLLANDKSVSEYVLKFRSGNDLLFWHALVPQTVDVNCNYQNIHSRTLRVRVRAHIAA